MSTDELMLATGQDSRTLQHMLRELDRWKLLSNDTEIGVTSTVIRIRHNGWMNWLCWRTPFVAKPASSGARRCRRRLAAAEHYATCATPETTPTSTSTRNGSRVC